MKQAAEQKKRWFQRDIAYEKCLGLILQKNRMVKGGVLKTWFWAISELFTTPWYRKTRFRVGICIPLINWKYCMRMK